MRCSLRKMPKNSLPKMDNYSKRLLKYALFQGAAIAATLTVVGIYLNGGFSSGTLVKILGWAFLGGAIAAVCHLWLQFKFAQAAYEIDALKLDGISDESILLQSAATYVNGGETVGGKLFLTNKRILFKCKKQHHQNMEVSIPIDAVLSITSFKILWFINSGISIKMQGEAPTEFVVNDLKPWFSTIVDTIKGDSNDMKACSDIPFQ